MVTIFIKKNINNIRLRNFIEAKISRKDLDGQKCLEKSLENFGGKKSL